MDGLYTSKTDLFETEEPESSIKPDLNLGWKKPVLASVCAGVGAISSGAIYGYFTMATTSILRSNTTLPFDVGDPTFFTIWFSSVAFLAALPAIFFSIWLQDAFGRKLCMLIGCGVAIVGWLLIITARHVAMLYAGAAVDGFAAIIYLPAVNVYIAEVSPTSQRGMLLCIVEVGLNFGIFATYCMGLVLSWRYLAIFILLFSALCIVCLLFIPETPRFLVFKNRKNQALRSIKWFYGELNEESTEKILMLIEDSLMEIREPIGWTHLLRKPLRKYFLVSEMMFVLQIACGFYTTRIMLTQILESLNTGLGYSMEIIVFAVLGFVGSVGCMFVVNRFSRRLFLLISTFIMIVAMATLGTYYSVSVTHPVFVANNLSWLPLVALVFSTLAYSLGLGPIPFMFLTEIFPTAARSKASVAAIFTFFICLFINIQMYGVISISLGFAGTFFISAGFSLAGLLLIYYFVPETKDKLLS